VCPICKVERSVQQWIDAGAHEGAIAFSCVGRYTGGPGTLFDDLQLCNYAGGGLFALNPVTVEFSDGKTRGVFEFAPVSYNTCLSTPRVVLRLVTDTSRRVASEARSVAVTVMV
jgi:hypothetical protein